MQYCPANRWLGGRIVEDTGKAGTGSAILVLGSGLAIPEAVQPLPFRGDWDRAARKYGDYIRIHWDTPSRLHGARLPIGVNAMQ